MVKKSPKTHIKFQMVHGQKIIMNPMQIRPFTWAKETDILCHVEKSSKTHIKFPKVHGQKITKNNIQIPPCTWAKETDILCPNSPSIGGCGVGDGGSRRLEFQYNPLSQ